MYLELYINVQGQEEKWQSRINWSKSEIIRALNMYSKFKPKFLMKTFFGDKTLNSGTVNPT